MTLRIDTVHNGIEKECSQLVVMEKKPIVSCKYLCKPRGSWQYLELLGPMG